MMSIQTYPKQQNIPIAAVVGPTASGKSRLAVELALRFDGEIVSADSMQIYKGMAIGTAKPTEKEMRGVPHHLIDFADPEKPFSVAEYVELAAKCVRDIHKWGRLPILAGGTGLYVRSFLQNIQFTEEERDDAFRAQMAAKAECEGAQALWDELYRIDTESASRIHPNNVGRVIRSLEIYHTTGKTMTQQLEASRRFDPPYHACIIGLDFADRQVLYNRINARVDEMLALGLEREAREVLAQSSKTAAQAIGYKEFLPYFAGNSSLEEAVDSIKQETRRYAKRQRTWFRRDKEIHWILADEHPDFSSVADEAARILRAWQENIR